jgi:selenophosphate synthetase-related protein
VTFSIGADCQAQALSIRAVGGQSQQDVEISVTQILMSPLNGA